MNARISLCPLLLVLLLAGCGRQDTPAPAAAASSSASRAARTAAVRKLVTSFGLQMKKVSTLAPTAVLRPQLRKVYSGLVTPALLEAWLDDPSHAPGRRVSSPWPAGIDIGRMECPVATNCRVTGSVRYLTSNEREHGGVAARRPVHLQVQQQAQGWRISAVHLGSLQH